MKKRYSCSSLTNNIGKQILTQFRYPLTLTFVQFGFISIFTWMYGNNFEKKKKKNESRNSDISQSKKKKKINFKIK